MIFDNIHEKMTAFSICPPAASLFLSCHILQFVYIVIFLPKLTEDILKCHCLTELEHFLQLLCSKIVENDKPVI